MQFSVIAADGEVRTRVDLCGHGVRCDVSLMPFSPFAADGEMRTMDDLCGH